MRYFAFCQGDILLTSDNQIPEDIADLLPIHPWTPLMEFHSTSSSAPACVALKLDTPISKTGYKMTNLRDSFEILDAESYALAGKARELLYWNDITQYCGICGSPMKRHTEI